MPAAVTSSQLNVRMEYQLRSAGDAVLERVGVAPAEIVRALWAKIARGVQECEQVLAVLTEQAPATAISRGGECLAAIESWQEELFALAGVDCATYVAPSDDDLEELLYDEWLERDAERVVA